ncbi:unnamed protein product [Adineta ricciae]|uniref:Uncharacterized protein n=1 Tax=Adineta ricciae TaxID=249248 RepID=A0A815JJL0_ADIRI|nr:unnamed protein product [Adineta ricciae]
MESTDMREWFMKNFTEEKYEKFVKSINDELSTLAGFRLAETPLFLSDEVRDRLIRAGDEIVDFILRSDFKQLTEKAIPNQWRCANENEHPNIFTMDFGLWKDENGVIVPRLIELQGFPSLHALAAFQEDAYRAAYDIPADWTIYFNDFDQRRYLKLFKEIIIGSHQPDEVVLMDVKPHEQHTAVDFYFTQKFLGIPIVGLDELQQEGKRLFYEREGQRKWIKRIYNRLIFDEVADDPNIFKDNVDLRQELDVEWINHPNWFYRISKYLLPIVKGDYVLRTYYLNEILDQLPHDLENYVLKPLFSFGGTGIVIDIKRDDIPKIKDPENWILERKIGYEPAFRSADDEMVKAEIRLMYFWPDGDQRPILTTNCTRLSTGKMINAQLNKDARWVGGTISFMKS